MEEPIAGAVIGVVMVKGRSGTMQAKAYELNSWRDAARLVISVIHATHCSRYGYR